MDSQTQTTSKRKSFLHFVLRQFYYLLKEEKNIQKKKYGIEALDQAIGVGAPGTNRKEKFKAYLTHIVPNLIFKARLSEESISEYFKELEILQKIIEDQNKKQWVYYFKGLYKEKKVNKLSQQKVFEEQKQIIQQ